MGLDVKGLPGMLENLLDLADGAAESMGAVIHAQGLKIIRESDKMVPVDTGRLRASSFVAAPQNIGGQMVVLVGYGTDYALAVHEAPMTLQGEPREGERSRGNYWDPQGQATNKFLEKAMNRHKSKFTKEARSLLEKFLDKGVGISILERPV